MVIAPLNNTKLQTAWLKNEITDVYIVIYLPDFNPKTRF